MRVKILRNLGKGYPALKEGQEADVQKELGTKLVERGLALLLEEPKVELKKSTAKSRRTRKDKE